MVAFHVPTRFADVLPGLLGGDHDLPPGASEADVKALEQTLKITLPTSYRDFLLLSDGAKLFSGRLQFHPTTNLVENTRKLWGGWYNEHQVFFAECAGRADDPDWFYGYNIYFDYQHAGSDEPIVGFFSIHPTDTGSTKLGFSDWIARAAGQQGYGLAQRKDD